MKTLLLAFTILTARLFAADADWQKKAVEAYPALGVKGSPLNVRFVELVNEKKRVAPDTFKDPSWPMVIAKQAADAIAPKAPIITVRSANVKRIIEPGILFGENTKYRYFFILKNEGNVDFEGTIKIRLYWADGKTGAMNDEFTGKIVAGGGCSVFFDSSVSPDPDTHGDAAIRRFRFSVSSPASEGEGVIEKTKITETLRGK